MAEQFHRAETGHHFCDGIWIVIFSSAKKLFAVKTLIKVGAFSLKELTTFVALLASPSFLPTISCPQTEDLTRNGASTSIVERHEQLEWTYVGFCRV